jgi:hypothetical protein
MAEKKDTGDLSFILDEALRDKRSLNGRDKYQQLVEEEKATRKIFKRAGILAAAFSAITLTVGLQQKDGQIFDFHHKVPDQVAAAISKSPQANPVDLAYEYQDRASAWEAFCLAAPAVPTACALLWFAGTGGRWHGMRANLKQMAPRQDI